MMRKLLPHAVEVHVVPHPAAVMALYATTPAVVLVQSTTGHVGRPVMKRRFTLQPVHCEQQ